MRERVTARMQNANAAEHASVRTLDPELIRSLLGPVVELVTKRMDDSDRHVNERHEENRKGRHDQANLIQGITERQFVFAQQMKVLEHRMQAIDGGDTGSGGVLSKLQQGQERLETSMAEMKSDLRSIRDGSPQPGKIQELQDWRNKWLGVAAAVSICGVLLTLITGLVAALWAIFMHMK